MSDGRLKAAIQITAELTAMARADGYRAGAEAMREAAATVADTRSLISLDAAHIAKRIRSLPIPEMER